MQSSAKYWIGSKLKPPSLDVSKTAALNRGEPKRKLMNINCRENEVHMKVLLLLRNAPHKLNW